ncbi:methylated-DNA--[protein]-cysteine S-methyltransferase [Escherichia coli]
MRAIPCGETKVISNWLTPSANRSGTGRCHACAANKLAIIISCHRVIRGDGALPGYRWGMSRKAQLLRREAENEER